MAMAIVEFKVDLTEEQREELRLQLEKAVETIKELSEILVEVLDAVLKTVRKVAEQLGRFFLKMQLLEWKVPALVADYIYEKMPMDWACRIGFKWFRRKVGFVE